MLDTVLERKEKTKWEFLPVIFANGVDDDLPGLTAAAENRRVQFDDKIYKENEDIHIYGRSLRFGCNFLWILGIDDPLPDDLRPGDAVIREVVPSRKIHIENCRLEVTGFKNRDKD